MENNNNKPIQLLIEDVKMQLNTEIAKIINESELPMCLINPILKDIFERCIDIEKQQYEAVKSEYEKEQIKSKDVE